ncbi:hypothetical protein GCM10010331_45470 [Streptomyces xanthochromogenes]|uniref:hypothetical protein n=1 Tax=Streptomyces xanthochromogenes TaxID=67384 RepID=UPI0016741F0D|nr:hypothetical protein [Streptomyces xanthochromogenes]GHB52734.1 hypothetical protein GCM10010331_45470 [Streptomyces xanthochromogenes]
MLPLILAAARTVLPALAGRAAAGAAGEAAASGGASRLLSGAQFGAGMLSGSHTDTQNSAPPTESNPVYNR